MIEIVTVLRFDDGDQDLDDLCDAFEDELRRSFANQEDFYGLEQRGDVVVGVAAFRVSD